MPLIAPTGRRHVRVRLLVAGLYVALLAGSATMILPLLRMAGGSMASAVDLRDRDLVPRFLHDDAALWRKYVEGLFNESLEQYNAAFDRDATSFEKVQLPPPPAPWPLAEAFVRFEQLWNQSPLITRALGFTRAEISRTVPFCLREFRDRMYGRYGGDLARMNRELGTDFEGWTSFYLGVEDYLSRRNAPAHGAFRNVFLGFKQDQPAWAIYRFNAEGWYRRVYLKSIYGRDIVAYNRSRGTAYASFDEVPCPVEVPASGPGRGEAEHFLRDVIAPLWIVLERPGSDEYIDMSSAMARLNPVPQEDQDALEDSIETAGRMRSETLAVLAGWTDPETGRTYRAPAESLRLYSADQKFRIFLAGEGDLDALNRKYGTAFRDFAEIRIPYEALQYRVFLDARPAIRREFAGRNFRTVFDHVLWHGRGVMNTLIYCGLAVLAALIVNPMAAYALSRFRPRSTYRWLLFLMLTMAFPAMVTQIPAFLMLRSLGLLNTFAALILPGLANGYSIFLLKGFFDSLPRELYESAELDGAGEWTIFRMITMSLSKPILAVTALQAFTTSYANFMFALLICQDESMWTLMVWLYQLQQRSGQGVVYASLLIAAVPTLVVFLLCQKVILRGIVVPVEK